MPFLLTEICSGWLDVAHHFGCFSKESNDGYERFNKTDRASRVLWVEGIELEDES
jgi:hypothetical protein